MIKGAEITISVKFFYTSENIFQHFIFFKKKDAKICFDRRYLLHDLFEKKLHSQGLHTLYDLEFIDRVDKEHEDERVILTFKRPEEKIKLSNYFFVVAGFLPETTGCDFCKFKEEKENGEIHCPILEKTFLKPYKRCRFFKQQDGMFKT